MIRIRNHKSDRRAALRLFCAPYAGGGTSVFRSWSRHLPRSIEVCSLELPGRDTLICQPPFARLPPLIEELASALEPYMDLPFALFGHSMGGLISFELARELRRQHKPTPEALFISAHRAAHLPDPRPPIHHLPEPEFISKLHNLQGTPAEVLSNQEVIDFFIPLLRADFALCETYDYRSDEPLACPIIAFGGREDSEVSPTEMAAWREQTYRNFVLHILPGNHFFIHTAAARMLGILSQELAQILRSIG